ncbi:MAG TPA: MmcQ/YjbR family DNA-binding protein [Terriglobales bacterium]|nr:MmcQ/YjbR family DNA-binding protein [Terriglobales bacterium]
MTTDSVREFCISLPHTTESIQWGNHLVLKIGGKMFAVVSLEPSEVWISFKSAPEEFAELTERPNIIPAPYLARNHWVGLESRDALTHSELRDCLRRSYELVFEKLPKRERERLARNNMSAKRKARKG